MHFVVVPASAQTTRAAISVLLQAGEHTVTAIYRDTAKAPSDFTSNHGFKAVRGDLIDAATLDFAGADAVLTMTPPAHDDSDFIARATLLATNVREAIARSNSVKRLVYVSSGGAQFSEGVGEIKTNYEAEQIFRDAAPEVVLIRNAYFMENWAGSLETCKEDPPHFYSIATPLDFKFPQVSTKDIGQACAEELLASGSLQTPSPRIYELHGPHDYSALDVRDALSIAMGKDIEARPIERNELSAFFGRLMPAKLAEAFVEMGNAFLPGGIIDQDRCKEENLKRGRTSLTKAMKELVANAS